mmetsp:Transcript_29187/g.43058  ORF Transcript_29187/g.43058 Transcript_29187/m.43058 type:complete len:85 (+) Transcript_29187:1060-1314(+)
MIPVNKDLGNSNSVVAASDPCDELKISVTNSTQVTSTTRSDQSSTLTLATSSVAVTPEKRTEFVEEYFEKRHSPPKIFDGKVIQ